MKEICSCVISVTERDNVSTSLLYMDVDVHSCALSLKALRLVQYGIYLFSNNIATGYNIYLYHK